MLHTEAFCQISNMTKLFTDRCHVSYSITLRSTSRDFLLKLSQTTKTFNRTKHNQALLYIPLSCFLFIYLKGRRVYDL